MYERIERMYRGVLRQRFALHMKILKISLVALFVVVSVMVAGSLMLCVAVSDLGMPVEQAAHIGTVVMWVGAFTAIAVAVVAGVAMLLNAVGCFDLAHVRRYVNSLDYLHGELQALHEQHIRASHEE